MTDTTAPAPTAKAARQGTVAALLARKQAARTRVTLLLDPDVFDELEAAQTAVAAAGDEGRAEAQARVDELEEQAEEAKAVLIIQALGGKAFRDLVDAHPPTQEQRAAVEEGGAHASWNPDNFPVALVAACLQEPKATVEEVQAMFDAWNQTDVLTIFAAALEVNTRSGATMGVGRR